MARFEAGGYAQVIATGKIGLVIDRERTVITLEFYDESSIEPDIYEFKDYELRAVELPRVKMSQLQPLVRGEITVQELTRGANLMPDEVETDSKVYRITAVDLLAGLENYLDKSAEDVYRWLDALITFSDSMRFPDLGRYNIEEAVTEKDILAAAFVEIIALHAMIYDSVPLVIEKADVRELWELLAVWVKSSGKDYADSLKLRIAQQYDCDNIDQQPEEAQRLFKECLDYCCDVMKEPEAIQRRGYCYYCGTKAYPNNWLKARDAFIEYYEQTGDASAANTLGYIYYYGRCTGGVPEYEKAFKYFSIGHAYTYFESTYKLADMLAHGYGVVRDGGSANHLYWSVYEQTIKSFLMGNFEGKFADAALRIGNCYREGIGVEKNLEAAYCYYLQADYAIRERTRVAKHYGDTVVFNGVQRALAEVRREYTEKSRVERTAPPEWIRWTLIEHRACKLTIKELKDGALALDIAPMKRRNEKKAPMMLITVPQADYCELKKKLRIKTAPASIYGMNNDKPEFVFDNVEYNWQERKASFYLYDTLVGEIITDYYTFTAPAKKKADKSAPVYHFATIVFKEGGRAYDYLCPDKTVAVGDKVIVNGYDGETVVKVIAVADKYEGELGLPIERFKTIVRKA